MGYLNYCTRTGQSNKVLVLLTYEFELSSISFYLYNSSAKNSSVSLYQEKKSTKLFLTYTYFLRRFVKAFTKALYGITALAGMSFLRNII